MNLRSMAMLFLLLGPAVAGDEGFSGSVGLQGGSRTLGFKYEAGITEGYNDRSGIRIPLLGVSAVRAVHTGQSDFRLHVLGIGYDQSIAPDLHLQICATPFGSLGGITGPAFGGDLYVGIRYRDYSVGCYVWSASGRRNPWNGQEQSHEMGLAIRKMF